MGAAAEDTRRVELAKIHVAKKQLGFDDETYRDVLRNVTGKESAADLDAEGRRRLLAHLERVGFKPKRRSRAWKDRQGAVHPVADDPHSRMARGLWIELHDLGVVRDPSERALAAFVKRQTGVPDLKWLAPERRNKVVEGLKAWLEREKAKREAAS